MRFLSLLLLSFYSSVLAAAPPISFQPNKGQTDTRVRYLSRSPQGAVFFTDSQIVFSREDARSVSLELIGGNSAAKWEVSGPTGDQTSYKVGRDPSRWAEQVPNYERLVRRNVYPGIDAAWHAANQRLEYDFRLAPYADPRRIRLRVKGAQRVYITREGELVISSNGRDIRQHKPVIYQTAVDGSRTQVNGCLLYTSPSPRDS